MAESADLTVFDNEAREYDAVLVVSFGGPEGPDDVMPFLDNVFSGLRIPPPVKARIAERYQAFGGVSPINAHTRAFIAALERRLADDGPGLPVYWGNRNWHPLLGDTLARMAADGVGRAVAYVTSVFGSYSGCRKYREDLFAAVDGLDKAPHIDKLRLGYNHPGFITAVSERLREARAAAPAPDGPPALLFTAHSLPRSMASRCDYQAQLQEACRLAAEAAGAGPWTLAYQSRNASYGEPWLGPSVGEALESVKAAGHTSVVLAPHRLRLRPYGSHPGPGRGSEGGGFRAWARHGARGHGRHPSRLRGHGAGTDRRADDGESGPPRSGRPRTRARISARSTAAARAGPASRGGALCGAALT